MLEVSSFLLMQNGTSWNFFSDLIWQVFATDKDVGIINGRVCRYIVEGFNLPFTVSETGMISLDFPLGPEAYDLYEFQVDAVDCGGMMSLKSTKVSITVATPCHEGKFSGEKMQ